MHEEEKSYKCHFCSDCFAINGNLKAHIESVHEKRKPFKCDICEFHFTTKSTLKRHVASNHSEGH